MSRAKIKGGGKIQSRARIWCFTINNPNEKEESHLTHQNFLEKVKSIYWQVEEGKENTPHIQGVVQFKSQITFDQIKKKLPTAHIEICRNFPASKTYCQKEEGRIRGPFSYPGAIKKLSAKEIGIMMKKEFMADMLQKFEEDFTIE